MCRKAVGTVADHVAMNAVVNDVAVQKNGAIMIYAAFNGSFAKDVDADSLRECEKVFSSTPIRWGGIHFCYDFKSAAEVDPNPIKIAQLLLDTLTRTKFRIHYGKSALQSHQISLAKFVLEHFLRQIRCSAGCFFSLVLLGAFHLSPADE